MKIATIIIAAVLLAGCSARNGLTPMPAFQNNPAFETQTPLASSCQIIDYTRGYRSFYNSHTLVGIKGPIGYVAVTAAVQNNMSNGVMVRSGEHKPTYVQGSGYYTFITFKTHKPARNVILRAVAKPTSGKLLINIEYCPKP